MNIVMYKKTTTGHRIPVNPIGSGFTLIELLVVISIIALLLSILTPSLNKVKEQGKKVVCANNMKQVVLALQMYAAENGGYTVPKRLGEGSFPMSWDMVAAEYFSTSQKDSVKEYLVCPADRKPRDQADNPIFDEYQGSASLARSYILNGALENWAIPPSGNTPAWFSNGSGIPAKDTNINGPADVLWLVEIHVGMADENYGISPGQPGYEGSVQGSNYWPTSWWPPSVAGFMRPYNGSGIAQTGDQHKGGGNWGYIDGHVEWFGYNTPPEDGGAISDTYKAFKKGPIYPFTWAHSTGMRSRIAEAGFTK
jgi:prepilin-type N-terminal cleavage/methylation domain-containing protein/prepilin-type processing-associated H-X9-DG protein